MNQGKRNNKKLTLTTTYFSVFQNVKEIFTLFTYTYNNVHKPVFDEIPIVDFKSNKKAWEALNVYFGNKLQFEQKLYYCRLGLITRATKMRVAGLRSFIF